MLNEPVLVLNRSWLPLQVANVRRSIVLLYLGHAHVVCPQSFRTYNFDDWKVESYDNGGPCLHATHFRLRIPEVVMLTEFNHTIRRRIRFNRKNIMLRDHYTCQYCGRRLPERELTLEHVHPVSKGGDTSWENVVVACGKCNNRKGNLTTAEAGIKLLRTPKAPRMAYSTQPSIIPIRKTWQPFLSKRSAAKVG